MKEEEASRDEVEWRAYNSVSARPKRWSVGTMRGSTRTPGSSRLVPSGGGNDGGAPLPTL